MPKLKINERLVLITGKSCIDIGDDLEEDDDVILEVKGTVRKVEGSSNDDGTKDVTYKVKQVSARRVK